MIVTYYVLKAHILGSRKLEKASFLPLGLKAQRGITIMVAGGRAAGRARCQL